VTGSFGSLTALGDERRCRAIVRKARVLRAGLHSTLHGIVFAILCPGPWGYGHRRPQFNDARDGFSFAICFTVSRSFPALNEGERTDAVAAGERRRLAEVGVLDVGVGPFAFARIQPLQLLVASGQRARFEPAADMPSLPNVAIHQKKPP
jgi:hypothetical protein